MIDELTDMQQGILLLGLLELSVVITENLKESPTFAPSFVRGVKKDANNFLKQYDKVINKICADRNPDVSQQLVDISASTERLLVNGIIWDKDEEA